jgi:hypothetical protein
MRGLSRFIPTAVLDAYKPVLNDGWELVAALYVAGLWLVVLANLIAGFTVSFQQGVETEPWTGLALPGAIVLSILALSLVLRLRLPQASRRGLWLLDAAVTLFLLLGVLAVVIGAIGLFASFGDGPFGAVVADFIAHIGDVVLGLVAIVWAMYELLELRRLMPLAPAANPASGPGTPPAWGPGTGAPGAQPSGYPPPPVADPTTVVPAPVAPVSSTAVAGPGAPTAAPPAPPGAPTL